MALSQWQTRLSHPQAAPSWRCPHLPQQHRNQRWNQGNIPLNVVSSDFPAASLCVLQYLHDIFQSSQLPLTLQYPSSRPPVQAWREVWASLSLQVQQGNIYWILFTLLNVLSVVFRFFSCFLFTLGQFYCCNMPIGHLSSSFFPNRKATSLKINYKIWVLAQSAKVGCRVLCIYQRFVVFSASG